MNNKIHIQKAPRTILHLITKEIYNGMKPILLDVKKCLNKLLEYCFQNDINQLDLPQICTGHDKIPWAKIENSIQEIFGNTSIIFNEFNEPQNLELNLNRDNDSIIVETGSESGNETIHSDNDNPINGLTYLDSCINTRRNQIIFKETNGKNSVKIEKSLKIIFNAFIFT